jgi:cytidylate kinase
MMASAVSARPVVRKFLLNFQQHLGRQKSMVFEGRDMGTVVFPDADVKIYLDADPQERARRRHLQLGGKQAPQSLNQVAQEMQQRDANDATRPVAPLKPAPDAHIIDSSRLSIAGVIDRIVVCIEASTAQSS